MPGRRYIVGYRSGFERPGVSHRIPGHRHRSGRSGRYGYERPGTCHRIVRGVLLPAVMLASLLAVMLAASPAQAFAGTPGDQALNWAENNALGHPYGYGGTGPVVYDCSGLVVASALHALGITLPRTTQAMLSGSAHLYSIPLSEVRRGDLLFYGTGHVEFATVWADTSFGAHDTGTRVGWQAWGGFYTPTAAMRLR